MFEGPEDYHDRIEDPALGIDEHCVLFIRGTGPIGYPGGAEVVNMQPPAALIKRGILSLPCIGDGRQSGTSGSPSILNASPEAAADGGLAILKTGDKVRIDLNKGSANITDLRGRVAHPPRRAEGQGRLPAPGQPDAVAGALPPDRRPARHRRLPRARDALPRHRGPGRRRARQSLAPHRHCRGAAKRSISAPRKYGLLRRCSSQ